MKTLYEELKTLRQVSERSFSPNSPKFVLQKAKFENTMQETESKIQQFTTKMADELKIFETDRASADHAAHRRHELRDHHVPSSGEVHQPSHPDKGRQGQRHIRVL